MPLRIRPKPSRIFTIVTTVVHGGAGIVLFMIFPAWAALFLALAVVISFIRVINQHVLLLNPSSIKELVWNEADSWTLLTNDNHKYVSTLLSSSYCHPKLAVLNFLSEHKKHSIVLMADALDKDIFRRLRVGITIKRAKLA